MTSNKLFFPKNWAVSQGQGNNKCFGISERKPLDKVWCHWESNQSSPDYLVHCQDIYETQQSVACMSTKKISTNFLQGFQTSQNWGLKSFNSLRTNFPIHRPGKAEK